MSFRPTGQFLIAHTSFVKDCPHGTVITYLEIYRMWQQTAGRLRGQDADITFWISQGWDKFKAYMDSNYDHHWISGKARKRLTKTQHAIQAFENDGFSFVIPLNHEASQLYGAGTKWCTASRECATFDKYFHVNNKILMYFIPKDKTRKKWACVWVDGKLSDVFDERSESVLFKFTNKEEAFNCFTKLSSELFYESFVKPHRARISMMQYRKIIPRSVTLEEEMYEAAIVQLRHSLEESANRYTLDMTDSMSQLENLAMSLGLRHERPPTLYNPEPSPFRVRFFWDNWPVRQLPLLVNIIRDAI